MGINVVGEHQTAKDVDNRAYMPLSCALPSFPCCGCPILPSSMSSMGDTTASARLSSKLYLPVSIRAIEASTCPIIGGTAAGGSGAISIIDRLSWYGATNPRLCDCGTEYVECEFELVVECAQCGSYLLTVRSDVEDEERLCAASNGGDGIGGVLLSASSVAHMLRRRLPPGVIGPCPISDCLLFAGEPPLAASKPTSLFRLPRPMIGRNALPPFSSMSGFRAVGFGRGCLMHTTPQHKNSIIARTPKRPRDVRATIWPVCFDSSFLWICVALSEDVGTAELVTVAVTVMKMVPDMVVF